MMIRTRLMLVILFHIMGDSREKGKIFRSYPKFSGDPTAHETEKYYLFRKGILWSTEHT